MLQTMFYFFGLIFFLAADLVLAVGLYQEFKKRSMRRQVLALRTEIANLLARVPDKEQREKATEVFSKAKTIEALQKVKARLVEIIIQPQQGEPNV